jgi:PAS domain S-box-containing protein
LNRKIHILFAEENTIFLKMIEKSLKDSGSHYQIETASSGEECLEKLQRKKFDILILDHALSDGNGLNWLKRFNEMGVGIPTVFVTAKGDSRLAIEAMKEGVFDYVNQSAECAKALPFVVHRALEGHGLMVEKVRLQKELIETKNFLESVVEKAGDAISVVDLEGKTLYWNDGAERIYGYSRGEVLGEKLFDLLYPRDEKIRMEEERSMQELMARVKNGEVVSNLEARRRTKDDREITVSVTVSPLRNAEGKMIGVSRICRDITHLKKAEERLILAERLSSLGELTAGVAHELRNPLAGIKINTQILSRKADLSELERRLLDSTQEGIEKIQKIVEDMLDFARPRAALFKDEAVNETVEKSLSIFHAKLRTNRISLVFEPGKELPQVYIDAHQIQQVLTNLFVNAIQAMENGGTLTVRTFRENQNGVGIEVRDTGMGISQTHLKKIFDPFFTTKSEGTGLGLSISLKILENHKATIDAVSHEGQGSTFTIHLPRRADHDV